MARSLIKNVGFAAAIFAAITEATKSYTVTEVYNATNFFDKFGHFVVSIHLLH